MIAERLRKSILQAAIQGKLTEQLPEDSDARDLLAEILVEKERLIKDRKIKKEKVLPEITEEEIPFEIPENWCWVRLGAISVFINGDRSSAYPKSTDYVSDGVPFFGAADMIEGKLSYKEVRFVSEEKFASLRSGKLKNQDLVCLLRGSIGKTAKFDKNEKYDTGFINAQMVIIRVINQCCLNYIEQLLNSDYFDKFISGVYTGTAVKQLPAEALRQLIVPLPPLREQNQIIDILEVIRPQLSNLEHDENKLDALQKSFPKKMKDSLLQSAIQGKLTEQLESDGDAHDLVADIQKEKARLIKEKKIKKEKDLPEIMEDEIPFDIPDNWCWVRFGDVVNYQMGKTPSRHEGSYWGIDVPWVSIADMIENGEVIQTKECISSKAFKHVFKDYISPKGTLIMSFKLTVGRVSFLGLNATHNEAIISIFPYNQQDIFRQYLFKILPMISQWGHSKDAIKGKTLNSNSLNNMIFPLPPLAEQHRIVERLDQIIPLCDALE